MEVEVDTGSERPGADGGGWGGEATNATVPGFWLKSGLSNCHGFLSLPAVLLGVAALCDEHSTKLYNQILWRLLDVMLKAWSFLAM
jgi:hypothetical protein